MTTRTPSIRGSHLKSSLRSLERLGAASARAVRDALSPATVEAIEAAGRLDWLPVQPDVELTEAVADVLGVQGCREWSRDSLRVTMDSPVLRPIVDATARLFNLSPASCFRVVPRALPQIYRDAGEMRFEAPAPDVALLVWDDLPDEMARSETYFEGVAGAFEAVYDVLSVQGVVRLDTHDAKARRIVFRCTW